MLANHFQETVTIMKEKADTPRPRKTVVRTAGISISRTAKGAQAETAVKKPRAIQSPPASRKKNSASAAGSMDSNEIAVAAFLNWCQRRNLGLPDDPFADWLMAENAMKFANQK